METTNLSLICPCYNEEDNVENFITEIDKVLKNTKLSHEIIFINDGSTDNTLKNLINIKKRFPYIKIINLSRNFGKEAALTAGLDEAKAEAIIPIDVDLQDPPNVIHQLIEKWKEGYDIVLAKREDRTSDSFLKSFSARLFYKVNNKISDVEIPEDVGDFRLISKKVADALKKLPENQRFMKGLFSWVGFKSAIVTYKRMPRVKGKSKFNGWTLWNFALEGITSFSTLPLRAWLYIGFTISFVSFLYGSFIVLKTIFLGVDTPGYASLITAILFLGGIQLIGIGVLGEYIGRIYKESKKRPIYIIESKY